MSANDVQLKNIHALNDERGKDNFADDHSHSPPPNDTRVNVTLDDNASKNGLRHRSAGDPGYVEGEVGGFHPSSSDKPDDSELNRCSRVINRAQRLLVDIYTEHNTVIIRVVLLALLGLYLAYVIFSLGFVRFGDEGSIRLLVGTIIGLLILGWIVMGDNFTTFVSGILPKPSPEGRLRAQTIIRRVLYVVSVVFMVTLLIVLVALKTPDNLISLAGLTGFLVLTWVTSINPARVNWHPVFWGFSIQFFFAVIILRTREGYEAFKWLGDRVTEFLAYSDAGASFVFGSEFRMHFFAFAILPVIVFFSAIISMLYYVGAMQAIVSVLGRFLAFCMGTTPAESINAAGNIFVGMTEAPLLIRPFIDKMTKSELHAVMVGGFATIAGSVLGAYIGFGVPANHLLSASVMSAPAALAISKLTYPETEEPQIHDDDYAKMESGSDQNLIDAASSGASAACKICAAVAVNVMAFLSILKFVNVTLTWFGERAGLKTLTFEFICSYVLYPVAVFMGTELGPDCRRVAQLVGIKTFTNEFIAYSTMKVMLDNKKTFLNYTTHYNASDPANIRYDDLDIYLLQTNQKLEGGYMSTRSEVIATYALCGFSNFGSMGIMLGALTAMAPHRKQDLASIVFRAMIAGNVACFFTACIAGLFFEDFK